MKNTAQIRKSAKSRFLMLRRRVNGNRIEFSSGFEDTPQNRIYLKGNAEAVFWEKYREKYSDVGQVPQNIHLDATKNACIGMNFLEYAKHIQEITRTDRNKFSEKRFGYEVEKALALFHNLDLIHITASKIKEWQTTQEKKGLSAKTIHGWRGTLSKVLRYAKADGLIQNNPLEFVKAPKIVKEEPTTYGLGEVTKLLNACDTFSVKAWKQTDREQWQQFKNMLMFGFFSGLRSGELIALKWEDIDTENNQINVERRIRQTDVDLPKGDKKRKPYLLPQAKMALERQKLKTGLGEWIWLTYKGEPYTCSSRLDIMFKKACERAQVKRGQFYNMRHSFVTLMQQLNQNPTWLKQHMGHNSIVTTEIYTGSLTPNLEAVNKIAV